MDKDLEKQAEQIFSDLLAVPVADRATSALAACGQDAALLARVQSLLGVMPQVSAFESDLTADAAAQATMASVGEQPGDKIGNYRLLEKIGEGGFGVVFTAEQQQPVRRKVAIKVIKLGMDTREVVKRFEAERQALALMDHPNIAKVFDAGATEAGRPYFVMELVRGSSVTEYADKHRLGTDQRVALVAQICRAVQHAHSKGIIHRDLKPSNVLVTVIDDKPVPKVIDFGIAKATQSRLTDQTLYTALRQLIGTPQYMSPEQADSDGSDIDTRSDIYSLGVLLYELLVGSTPLDARELRSAAVDAMRKMIRDSDPAKPSTRLSALGDTLTTVATNRGTDVRQLSRQLHGELDWIVMRALEKDRSRRYETAAGFADDLGRYLAGEAVLAGPVSGTYRLRKLARRHRTAVIVGTALAACLLLGVAGTTWGLVQARRERSIAVTNERRAVVGEQEARLQQGIAETGRQEALAQRRVAETKSAEATATLRFLTDDVLKRASPRRTRDDRVTRTLVDALITPALATVGQRFAKQPLVGATIREALAEVLLDLGRADLAEPPAKAAWDTRRSALGDDDPATLDAMHDYAQAMNYLGNYAEAERLDHQEWDVQRRLRGADDWITVSALNDYAAAVDVQGRHAEAERLFKQVLDADRRTFGETSPVTLLVLRNYAATIAAQDRPAEAEPLLKQALDGMRHSMGEDHPDTLMTLYAYAGVIKDRGDHAEADRLYKQCWTAQRRVLGDNHPDTLITLNDYALDLDQQGNHTDAEPLLKQCWVAFQQSHGDDHPYTLVAKRNYALCLQALSGYAAAEPLFEQVWKSRKRISGPDHPQTLEVLNDYASAVTLQGRPADAEPLLKQCWEGYLRVRGPDYPDTLSAQNNYAMAIFRQGRFTAANPLFKHVWESQRRLHGEDHPVTLRARSTYVSALLQSQQFADAEPLLRQDLERLRRVTPADEMNVANAESGLGTCLAHLGPDHAAEAESLLREAISIRSKKVGPRAAPTTKSASLLADLLEAEHRHEDAAKVRADAGLSPTTQPAR